MCKEVIYTNKPKIFSFREARDALFAFEMLKRNVERRVLADAKKNHDAQMAQQLHEVLKDVRKEERDKMLSKQRAQLQLLVQLKEEYHEEVFVTVRDHFNSVDEVKVFGRDARFWGSNLSLPPIESFETKIEKKIAELTAAINTFDN